LPSFTITDRPKAPIADTLKGRGVSFMEHPIALRDGRGAGKGTRARRMMRHSGGLSRLPLRLSERFMALAGTIADGRVLTLRMKVARNALGEPVSQGAVASAFRKANEYVVGDMARRWWRPLRAALTW
jgi:hypothetical protein